MPDELLPRNTSTIAIITGGTQGLGLAIAKRLAREGAPGIRSHDRRFSRLRSERGWGVPGIGLRSIFSHSSLEENTNPPALEDEYEYD
jgi:hypothetical protein